MAESRKHKCVICKSPLNEGAVQCLACKGFQNPVRRFLSNMDVKSLVALVPIVTLAFAFLQDRITVHGSDVLVTALDCSTAKIELMAANTGDRAGVIKSAQVRVRIDGSTGDGAHRLRSTGAGVSAVYTVVKPEEPAFMSMVPMTGQAVTPLPRHPEDARQCSYQFEIEVVEFQQQSNETKIIYTSCDCPH